MIYNSIRITSSQAHVLPVFIGFYLTGQPLHHFNWTFLARRDKLFRSTLSTVPDVSRRRHRWAPGSPCMILSSSPQLYSKTLNPTKFLPLPQSLNMKDRPPSSYGAVYIPPHHRHRLRSVITVPSAGNTVAAAASRPHLHLNSKPALESKQSTFANSKENASTYLPPHHRYQEQQQELQKKNSVDEASSEGSDREIELLVQSVSLARWECESV